MYQICIGGLERVKYTENVPEIYTFGPKNRENRRKARGVSRYRSIVLLGQCHLKLIWKPRSI